MLKSLIPIFNRRISIKVKLTFITIIFILYPAIIIGYFGYRNYSDVMKEKAITDSQNTARELSDSLSARIEKLRLFSVQIFYDRKIYDANNELLSQRMDFVSENNFQQYLQSILFSKSELSEILIYFNKGNKVFQANRTLVATTDSFSELFPLYQTALKSNGTPTWHISRKDGKVTGIYIAKTIYDLQDIKKEIGLLVFKVNEQYLFEVFNNFIAHSKQNVGVYTNDGQEIFAYNTFQADTRETLNKLFNSSSNSHVSELKIPNDKLYLLYDTVQPVNWKLAIGISDNVLLKEVRNISRFILLLCIATLPICVMLINYLYIDIIKPLNLLIKKMHQIERGDIGITIESKRMDEFGYVFRTFNKMSHEIKNLINTVYKKQIAMKDAEIKALQAQINPHFLFNTLEAINWKAKMNGVDEVSDMVSALSCIIEANLNRKNEKFIPVHREIEYINSYTFLIQKRFGKKIQFHLHVDEQTLNCIIPKLMVQPIIENAIYHGLEMKKGGGSVDISFKMDQDLLLIIVADDGLGIEEDLFKKLKENLSDEKFISSETSYGHSSKIGVLNVHRRIKLLYGEGFGLEIYSESGKGTTVMIKLPTSVPKGDEANV